MPNLVGTAAEYINLQLMKVIGEESLFPMEHRVLNIVLFLGTILSFLSGLSNFVLGLGPILVMIGVSLGIIGIILCYLSIVKKQYLFCVNFVIFICIFIITPVHWIGNGGILGGTTTYVLIFSSMIAVLLRGSKRILALGSLIIMTLALMILEYKNPSLITGYQGEFYRYIDIVVGLITTLIANASLYIVILHFYIREQQRSGDYLVRIEKHHMEMEFQYDLRVINEKLQQEIDERKQVEQELRMSEERFAKSFQFNPIPMCVFSANGGHFIDVNDSFVNAFDFQRSEVIGKTPTALHICVKLEDCLKNAIKKNSVVYNMDVVFTMKSGIERIGLFSAEMIELNGERCLLCAINDITERCRMEQEMARLDRLNLVGEMAASIGHEVRNPLTTVRGFLQMFQVKKEYARQREFFDLMIEELDRANSIISEFLSLAKNKKIDLASHSLNIIISKLYPLIQADAIRAGKTVTLQLGEIPNVLLDENEIRQCVLNIVRNGVEAIQPKGIVAIKTYLEDQSIVLEIKDNGEGISSEVLEKFGTPFVTTKEKGTGLGIPICYRIAERHKAKIEIKTSEAGTAFFIKFKPI